MKKNTVITTVCVALIISIILFSFIFEVGFKSKEVEDKLHSLEEVTEIIIYDKEFYGLNIDHVVAIINDDKNIKKIAEILEKAQVTEGNYIEDRSTYEIVFSTEEETYLELEINPLQIKNEDKTVTLSEENLNILLELLHLGEKTSLIGNYIKTTDNKKLLVIDEVIYEINSASIKELDFSNVRSWQKIEVEVSINYTESESSVLEVYNITPVIMGSKEDISDEIINKIESIYTVEE